VSKDVKTSIIRNGLKNRVAISKLLIGKDKVLTEEEIRKLFSAFKSFVAEKNIPECKKFIASYVDRVVVYKDKVAVTLKVFVDGGEQPAILTAMLLL
jgi:hypothetical protein